MVLENANEDATLAISYPPVPAAGLSIPDDPLTGCDDGFPGLLKDGVVAVAPMPLDNSIRVGCFGMGGSCSVTVEPKGFLDPV